MLRRRDPNPFKDTIVRYTMHTNHILRHCHASIRFDSDKVGAMPWSTTLMSGLTISCHVSVKLICVHASSTIRTWFYKSRSNQSFRGICQYWVMLVLNAVS